MTTASPPQEILFEHKGDVCQRCGNKSLDEKCSRCRWQVADWIADWHSLGCPTGLCPTGTARQEVPDRIVSAHFDDVCEHCGNKTLDEKCIWCRWQVVDWVKYYNTNNSMKVPDEILQAHSDDVCSRCGHLTFCEKCSRCRWEVAGWIHDLKEKNAEDIASNLEKNAEDIASNLGQHADAVRNRMAMSNLGQHAGAVRNRMANKKKTAKATRGDAEGG